MGGKKGPGHHIWIINLEPSYAKTANESNSSNTSKTLI